MTSELLRIPISPEQKARWRRLADLETTPDLGHWVVQTVDDYCDDRQDYLDNAD